MRAKASSVLELGADADPPATHSVAVFTWSTVPSEVVRELLRAEYKARNNDGRYDEDVEELRSYSDVGLGQLARRVFGRPPKKDLIDNHVKVLVKRWIPVAEDDVLEKLVTLVQAGLEASERNRRFRSRSGRMAFLQQRNHTKTFVTNVRKAFIAAHKESRTVEASPVLRNDPAEAVRLSGSDAEPPHQLYAHQKKAHSALDELMKRRRSNRRGIVVLPTGAGKTDTLVAWLVPRLAANPQLRVLWLAHRQELLEQAVSRFQRWAPTMPTGSVLTARVVHAQAAGRAVLGTKDIDVAIVSFASLCTGWGRAQKNVLDKFLERPTIIVVDEAHHAGAESYRLPLEHAKQRATEAMIGLTATPNPAGSTARARVRHLLGKPLIEIPVEVLVEKGILARPVLHTIDTGEAFDLDPDEIAQAVKADVPPSVLRRVAHRERNRLIVDTIAGDFDRWGKALLFAASIEHAERLADMLRQTLSDDSVGVVHSRIDASRRELIEWFRNRTEPSVLVSVGMLTEGIDIPDAQTAFLARPTTSHILLRQMVGRVLRGPRSGGTPEAHVVDFRDEWTNFADILEPAEVLPYAAPPIAGKPGHERQLPPVRSDDNSEVVTPDVVAAVERMERAAVVAAIGIAGDAAAPHLDPTLVSARLVGFYRLPERCIPVFDHQSDAYDVLVKAARNESLQGRPPLSFFDDTFPPYPTPRSLRDLLMAVRNGEDPEWIWIDASIGPQLAARRLNEEGPFTESQRAELVREVYEGTLARAAYPTAELFEEAVERELRRWRARNSGVRPPGGLDAETAVNVSPPSKRLRPEFDRKLKPIFDGVLDRAPELLPPHVRQRLGREPTVEWTHNVVSSTLAHWSITLQGKKAGRQVIRVNRLLRTPSDVVSDEMLAYLLWHELLHHLLPGQGHDAEFREFEARWPNAAALDGEFAVFHEKWQTRPEKYA